MAVLPTELSYGTVTGKFLEAVMDTNADPDLDPDARVPVGASVTFTPVTLVKVPAAHTFVLPKPITVSLDGNGELSVNLVATNDQDMVPYNWLYKVTFDFPGTLIAAQYIQVFGGGTQDLTDLIEIEPLPENMTADLLSRVTQLEQEPAAVGMAFSMTGMLQEVVGTNRFYNDTGANLLVSSVRATVGTPPTGSSVVIDVNVDGTSIFTNQSLRPTIADGGNTVLANFDQYMLVWPAGSYLTIDVDQIGSTTPGENLTVNVLFV